MRVVGGGDAEPAPQRARRDAAPRRRVLVRARPRRATRPSSASCCRWPMPPPTRSRSTTAAIRADSRPEYYDFDLFRASEGDHALDDRRLVELGYTVFDTETTGLRARPAGDEIIQIGAARIVNGKLLRQEAFEQLVDPQRDIPAAGIPIHGIRPEMVQGQPTIDRCCRPSTPSRTTPCWWRTTRPSTCASCSCKEARHRPALRPAGARHPAAVGRGAPEPGVASAGGDRRALRHHRRSAATPRWATPSSPPRSSSS